MKETASNGQNLGPSSAISSIPLFLRIDHLHPTTYLHPTPQMGIRLILCQTVDPACLLVLTIAGSSNSVSQAKAFHLATWKPLTENMVDGT